MWIFRTTARSEHVDLFEWPALNIWTLDLPFLIIWIFRTARSKDCIFGTARSKPVVLKLRVRQILIFRTARSKPFDL